MPARTALAVALTALVAPLDAQAPREAWQTYLCLRTLAAPTIDGRLDEPPWRAAPWSDDFVDIEGERRPVPPWRTRVKMLWDDRFLYIAAELEEPHVWATLTERDAVIYQDDDFEVFIDPDGDTHEYYELEINALGTVWDLFLVRPYRDGGPALHGWDIAGLVSAVAVDGTLNDPSDRDRGWTVELAIPWSALAEAAPGRRAPVAGERWRINFSRVDWDVDVVDGAYHKRRDAEGRPLPEHNWVWSPQGAIDMHRPEMWGIVEFDDIGSSPARRVVAPDPDQAVQWYLRQVYYAQREHLRTHGHYTSDWDTLGPMLGASAVPPERTLRVTPSQFEATATGTDGRTMWHIRQDGKIWSTR